MEITKENIIEAAKNAAAKVDGVLSRSDFIRLTGISEYYINKYFPEGRWSEVKELAGLKRHPFHREPLSDDELLLEYHRVASELGDIPTWTVFADRAKISADVVRRHLGGTQGTLKRYREWLEIHEPTSSLLDLLGTKSQHEIPPPPPPPVTIPTNPTKVPEWSKTDGTEYGAPIDFRGLRHAPINEQGVVFLFGMVSYELGFIVEAVHNKYPDCEAKRCIDRKRNRWQSVRIEFEYQSSNFREHSHNTDECDIIVCWKHNWPECPLEVIELRRFIDKLEG
ncbi:MAG: hypothetical protein ACYS30_21125 [Planctomycetota bacterium]|jgi:hypothetical protein